MSFVVVFSALGLANTANEYKKLFLIQNTFYIQIRFLHGFATFNVVQAVPFIN